MKYKLLKNPKYLKKLNEFFILGMGGILIAINFLNTNFEMVFWIFYMIFILGELGILWVKGYLHRNKDKIIEAEAQRLKNKDIELLDKVYNLEVTTLFYRVYELEKAWDNSLEIKWIIYAILMQLKQLSDDTDLNVLIRGKIIGLFTENNERQEKLIKYFTILLEDDIVEEFIKNDKYKDERKEFKDILKEYREELVAIEASLKKSEKESKNQTINSYLGK